MSSVCTLDYITRGPFSWRACGLGGKRSISQSNFDFSFFSDLPRASALFGNHGHSIFDKRNENNN